MISYDTFINPPRTVIKCVATQNKGWDHITRSCLLLIYLLIAYGGHYYKVFPISMDLIYHHSSLLSLSLLLPEIFSHFSPPHVFHSCTQRTRLASRWRCHTRVLAEVWPSRRTSSNSLTFPLWLQCDNMNCCFSVFLHSGTDLDFDLQRHTSFLPCCTCLTHSFCLPPLHTIDLLPLFSLCVLLLLIFFLPVWLFFHRLFHRPAVLFPSTLRPQTVCLPFFVHCTCTYCVFLLQLLFLQELPQLISNYVFFPSKDDKVMIHSVASLCVNLFLSTWLEWFYKLIGWLID